LYAAIHAETRSRFRTILESTISDVDSALEEVVNQSTWLKVSLIPLLGRVSHPIRQWYRDIEVPC
jgi:hypothetical protein